MSRRQFTTRALLLAMLIVAAFLGGMAVQRHLAEPRSVEVRATYDELDGIHCTTKVLTLPDGSEWLRTERTRK